MFKNNIITLRILHVYWVLNSMSPQMAASIIKALFESITFVVCFSTSHVGRGLFPWELLKLLCDIGRLHLGLELAQDKKHTRVSNLTNVVTTQYRDANKWHVQGNISPTNSSHCHAFWAVAPSCWNRTLSRTSKRFPGFGHRKSLSMAQYRLLFTVTLTIFFTKKDGPITIKF